MDKLIDYINYIFLISIAAERFTDILKRAIIEKYNPNKSVYQVITFIFGIIIFKLNPLQIDMFTENIAAILMGLAVSGGSSVWHEVLDTLSNLNKNLTTNKNLN